MSYRVEVEPGCLVGGGFLLLWLAYVVAMFAVVLGGAIWIWRHIL